MSVKELVILSGKGGTGKTTICASLAASWTSNGEQTILADCDVDAPDLHILLDPKRVDQTPFAGPQKGFIDSKKCIACGKCAEHCKFGAISQNGKGSYQVNLMRCEGCSVCEFVCPAGAVTMIDTQAGEIFHSNTPYGAMIHGRLIPGEETSGKLVSAVREKAKKLAEEKGFKTVIIDGSPGVGCNVISSVTGSSTAIIVTEPSQSGLHDMLRLMELLERFSIKYYVIINKFDISPDLTEEIEEKCREKDIPIILKVPFSSKIVESISQKKIPSIHRKKLFKEWGWEECVQKLKNEVK